MKRIGVVGVGKWAIQLREAFELEGCRVVAHARKSPEPHPNSGPLVSVEEMVRMEDVDLVVAAADPETTTRAVELCAEWCKPVVATKPLLRHPRLYAAPISVDFWRLYSLPWIAFANRFRIVRNVDSRYRLTLKFVGDGPKRGFSGLLDYGPHVFATLEHLGVERSILKHFSFDESPQGVVCVGSSDDGRLRIEFGNGATHRTCHTILIWQDGDCIFEDTTGIQSYTASSGEVVRQEKRSALRGFVRQALAGEAANTYAYSKRAAFELDRILAEQARQRDEPAGHPLHDAARYPVPDQR